MPRGRKRIRFSSPEEHLQAIDAQMEQHLNAIQDLKEKRKNLIASKDEADAKKILEFLKESGKTPEEALEVLREHFQAE